MVLKIASVYLLLVIFSCINLNVAINYKNVGTEDFKGESRIEYEQSRLMQHQRNIRDTNGDCEPGTLDQMDLFNLVNIAVTSEHCSKEAANAFERTFSQKIIQFENVRMNLYDLNTIEITDIENGSEIIKFFGHLITKLSLYFDYKDLCNPEMMAQNSKLLGYINKYCRNSLVDLAVHYSDCDVGIFNEIKGPFEKVENVSINILRTTLTTENFQLNKIFPRVRHLDLNFDRISDPHFVDCTFSNLQQLSIAAGLLDQSLESTFINLLKKNPQIKYISTIIPPPKAVQLINEHVPKLEELRILMDYKEDSTNTKLFFPSLRRLNLWLPASRCYPPKKITFGTSLDEIVLLCPSVDIGNEYFNFLFKYANIRKLSAGDELNNAHLRKLIGKFSKLSEAFFSFADDVTTESILKFVKKSNQLNLLRFYQPLIGDPEEFKKQLEAKLGNTFGIRYQNTGALKEFFIERKIPIQSESNSATTLITSNVIVLFMLMYISNDL